MINWDNMNKISTIITIGSSIGTFIAGLKFYKVTRWWEYKKIKNNLSKSAENDGILIISLGKNDIRNQVKLWLKENKYYKNIQSDRIETVEKINEDIVAKDIDSIMREVVNKKIKLQQKGVRKIHLFIAGPVSIATMVGAELANSGIVCVYHHNFNSEKKYEFWGTLKRNY